MDLEAGCEFGAGLTPELIEQAKGTAEYELLDESIEKMSVVVAHRTFALLF